VKWLVLGWEEFVGWLEVVVLCFVFLCKCGHCLADLGEELVIVCYLFIKSHLSFAGVDIAHEEHSKVVFGKPQF
jgi:hypothetical protein